MAVLPPRYIETWRERTTQPPFQQVKITSFPPQVYGTRISRNPCKHAVRVPAGISRSGFVHPLFGTSAGPPPVGPSCRQPWARLPAAVVPGDYNLGRHCAGAVHASFATSCVSSTSVPRAPTMGAPAAHLAETYLITRAVATLPLGERCVPVRYFLCRFVCLPLAPAPPQTFPRTT